VVETDDGLILVDTGLGVHDHLHPSPMVRLLSLDFGVHRGVEHTALHQLARFGHAPEYVRDIVLTHLHFDHAGGAPDFPHARLHVHRREYEAMRRPRTWIEIAYDRADFAHEPKWVFYDLVDSEWLGFDAIRLPFTTEMYLVPLFGHTRGQCGVAIRDKDGWVFQCADALPLGADFDLTPAFLNRIVLGPHVPRLRAWSAEHPEVRLLAGHMPRSFFEARGEWSVVSGQKD
jgi:glyoxylase-like metal-dependent hydrolase (beta-lactamase superfamily II)